MIFIFFISNNDRILAAANDKHRKPQNSLYTDTLTPEPQVGRSQNLSKAHPSLEMTFSDHSRMCSVYPTRTFFTQTSTGSLDS